MSDIGNGDGAARLPDAELDELAARVAEEVATGLADASGDGGAVSGATDSAAGRALAHRLILEGLDRLARGFLAEGRDLTDADDRELQDRVRSRLFGLAEFDRLVRDPDLENVFVNGWDTVWGKRCDGTKVRLAPFVHSDEALAELVRQAAAREGRSERRFDRGQPWVSFRLADGSRLTAVRDVSGRTVLALRRHRHPDTDLDELQRLGTVSRLLVAFLIAAVRARFNLLIVGGTDAGKTTILRALLNAADPDERLVTVEDTLELQLSRYPDRHRDINELECRDPNVEGHGEVAMRDLTRLALRLAPDRLIVGEARGPEILEMFQAMCQGNDGSMGHVARPVVGRRVRADHALRPESTRAFDHRIGGRRHRRVLGLRGTCP